MACPSVWSRYEGAWVNGERHGEGTYVFPSGAKYEGQWESGRMHGRGLYMSSTGTQYEGSFRCEDINKAIR